MDISSILGILFGFGMLILGFALEKGNMGSLFLMSPAIIVFGGTLGAIMLSYRLKDVLNIPKLIIQACRAEKSSIPTLIDFLVMLSESARKDGLLSLERVLEAEQEKNTVDPLLVRGTIMVIDGTDINEIRERLETEIYVYEMVKKVQASIFDSAGGFSPTMGIIGTVMGLIQVLSNMDSAEKLAKSIAVAFIATLYGVCFANIVYIPIANKLKLQLKFYKLEKEVIIDGLCAIRNGENPKILRERLSAYFQIDAKTNNKDGDKKKKEKENVKTS
jgi:chemotaxis protein MotA